MYMVAVVTDARTFYEIPARADSCTLSEITSTTDKRTLGKNRFLCT